MKYELFSIPLRSGSASTWWKEPLETNALNDHLSPFHNFKPAPVLSVGSTMVSVFFSKKSFQSGHKLASCASYTKWPGFELVSFSILN